MLSYKKLIDVLMLLKSSRYVVSGQSMLPSISHNQIVFANRYAFQSTKPKRGDIVIVAPPATPNLKTIKRVIGLPNEIVTLTQHGVSVNGTLLAVPWATNYTHKIHQRFEWITQTDQYIVLGDNISLISSNENSRTIGLIGSTQIVSKVWFRLWPVAIF